MNSSPLGQQVGLPCEPGRGYIQDLPLLAKALVLTLQATEFVTLRGREAVVSDALVQIRLLDPASDRVGTGLVLLREALNRPASSNQLEDLSALIRRVGRM